MKQKWVSCDKNNSSGVHDPSIEDETRGIRHLPDAARSPPGMYSTSDIASLCMCVCVHVCGFFFFLLFFRFLCLVDETDGKQTVTGSRSAGTLPVVLLSSELEMCLMYQSGEKDFIKDLPCVASGSYGGWACADRQQQPRACSDHYHSQAGSSTRSQEACRRRLCPGVR